MLTFLAVCECVRIMRAHACVSLLDILACHWCLDVTVSFLQGEPELIEGLIGMLPIDLERVSCYQFLFNAFNIELCYN